MPKFLTDIPKDEAIAAWGRVLSDCGVPLVLGSERIPLSTALRRVTSRGIWAKVSSPSYFASGMDGFAVDSALSVGAADTVSKKLTIDEDAFHVDTGDPMPSGTNAVIPIENVTVVEDYIEINAAVPPLFHVRSLGEDVVMGELVLSAYHEIRPQDLGLLAASGNHEVDVVRRPRVAIIPTGSELVPIGQRPNPGEIIESNSLMLAGFAHDCGCDVTCWEIQRDSLQELRKAVQDAGYDHDLILVNAGTSQGDEDFTTRVIADLGKVAVHGVAIRPGHPIVLGVITVSDDGRNCAVVGIPGYPVSAALAFELFCKPLLEGWQKRTAAAPIEATAVLTRKVVSPVGDDEYVRVSLGRVGQRLLATPLAGGAAVQRSMVRADGVLVIPRFLEGKHAGDSVTVTLSSSIERISNSILVTGSHDLTLDLLATELQSRGSNKTLTASHVGSMGGLYALNRDEAHLAGCHLLDEVTGQYNVAAVEKILTGCHVKVVGFVGRIQGLIVPRGNPKSILNLSDLTRSDVAFINRQRGSGTRVLLDYLLSKNGISPRQIRGYDRQEYTHMGVAAFVANGACDCGLGVLSAANALGLDFVPLMIERYDLIVRREHYESEHLAGMLNVVRSKSFSTLIDDLGGYDTNRIGQLVYES